MITNFYFHIPFTHNHLYRGLIVPVLIFTPCFLIPTVSRRFHIVFRGTRVLRREGVRGPYSYPPRQTEGLPGAEDGGCLRLAVEFWILAVYI